MPPVSFRRPSCRSDGVFPERFQFGFDAAVSAATSVRQIRYPSGGPIRTQITQQAVCFSVNFLAFSFRASTLTTLSTDRNIAKCPVRTDGNLLRKLSPSFSTMTGLMNRAARCGLRLKSITTMRSCTSTGGRQSQYRVALMQFSGNISGNQCLDALVDTTGLATVYRSRSSRVLEDVQ